jgi:hypothetical protein
MHEISSANSAPSSGTGISPSALGAAKPANRARTRSRVTTGRRVFVEGDGNSRWARRYRDLISAHCQDLGGQTVLSEAKISLIKRVSTLELECEQAEGKLSMGEEIDLDLYQRMLNTLRRALEALGLERKARDVTPDGVEIEIFSPMRARWAAEAAAAAAKETTE